MRIKSNDVIRMKNSLSSREGENFRYKNIDIYEFMVEPEIKTR